LLSLHGCAEGILSAPRDVANLGPADDGHKVRLDVDASVAAVQSGGPLTIDRKTLTITGSATDMTAFNATATGAAAVSFTGPGVVLGGLTLGPDASLTISGPGVKWSANVVGAGTTAIAPSSDVTVQSATSPRPGAGSTFDVASGAMVTGARAVRDVGAAGRRGPGARPAGRDVPSRHTRPSRCPRAGAACPGARSRCACAVPRV
jgi:hypothetical protein